MSSKRIRKGVTVRREFGASSGMIDGLLPGVWRRPGDRREMKFRSGRARDGRGGFNRLRLRRRARRVPYLISAAERYYCSGGKSIAEIARRGRALNLDAANLLGLLGRS